MMLIFSLNRFFSSALTAVVEKDEEEEEEEEEEEPTDGLLHFSLYKRNV